MRRTWLSGLGSNRWVASATFRPTPPRLLRTAPLDVVFKISPELLVSAFAVISTATIPITASLAGGSSLEVRMGTCKKSWYQRIPGSSEPMYSRLESCYWLCMGDLKTGMSEANQQRATYSFIFTVQKFCIFHRDTPTCTSVSAVTATRFKAVAYQRGQYSQSRQYLYSKRCQAVSKEDREY